MRFGTTISWLITGAGVALIVCAIIAALRPQLPTMLRFGPITTVGAYIAAGVLQLFVARLAPALVIVVACFGLWLAVRFLRLGSSFSYLFATVSLVFWSGALFVSAQYFARTLQ